MTQRPIIFSGPMVRAILEGRKTQTRRVMKTQPFLVDSEWRVDIAARPAGKDVYWWPVTGAANDKLLRHCPYGLPGDLLWVRETWQIVKDSSAPPKIWYRADPGVEDCVAKSLVGWPGWRPAIHMPRDACRLVLEITAVRVERLQAISEADAIAEGLRVYKCSSGDYPCYAIDDNPGWTDARFAFEVLWNRINEKRGHGWVTDPWVWVVEFKLAAPPKGGPLP